jgi:hypothetical protein
MKCSIGGCNNRGGKVVNPKNLDGLLLVCVYNIVLKDLTSIENIIGWRSQNE